MKMLYDWNEAGIPHWTRYKANIVVILHKKKGPCEVCIVILLNQHNSTTFQSQARDNLINEVDQLCH